MEELGFDNIMSDFDIEGLFGGEEGSPQEPVQQKTATRVDQTDNNENNEKEPTEVNPSSMFGGLESPESVGADNNDKTGGNPGSDSGAASPNFYSSILGALKDDGVLPELTDEEIEGWSNDKEFNDQSFKDVIEKVLDSRLDARTKRIQDALDGGADIDQVKQYEGIIATLQSISEEALSEESPQGEDLRRRVIAQDYMNRGFSQDRIQRELKKTFDAGLDVEDAKEALQNNMQFYQSRYQDIIKTGQEARKRFQDDNRRQAEDLKKSIVYSQDGIFNDIGIDKKTRQKIYDNITKPVYKDDSGTWYTELQKYEREHKTDFLKYISMFYVMTDGFKNIDKVVNKQVQKKNKSYIADLEKKLSNTQRNSSGTLKLVGQGDPDS